MVNILLVGNGFDRAHNLPTSYKQFLDYLIKKELSIQNGVVKSFRDDPNIITGYYGHKYTFDNGRQVHIMTENRFLRNVLSEVEEYLWSDLEVTYFKQLNESGDYNSIVRTQEEFEYVKSELIKYIKSIEQPAVSIHSLEYFFKSSLFHVNNVENLIVDFNYTPTLISIYDKYLRKFKILDIHNKIEDENSTIIFGHDISEKEKKSLLNDKPEKYFDNIKIFEYSASNKFAVFKEFINTANQNNERLNVFVLGHSCSVSDVQIFQELFKYERELKFYLFYFNQKGHRKMIYNLEKTASDFDIVIPDIATSFDLSFAHPQWDDVENTAESFRDNLDDLYQRIIRDNNSFTF